MKNNLQFVLHGHMPYVLHHGSWPHGEHWLYEAALEVYLPLLSLLERTDMSLTLGMTPVLLTQLRSPQFIEGMYRYIKNGLHLLAKDKRDLDVKESAQYWEQILQNRWDQLVRYDGDIVAALANHAKIGNVELLSSFATHAYAPLLSCDQSIEEQIQTGLSLSESMLGFRPKGIWLPECAFSPERECFGQLRRGVDRILEDAGVRFFYVEDQAFVHARSEGLFLDNQFYKTDWGAVHHSPQWAWRTLFEPHWVSTVGNQSNIAAFAREPEICAQIWSSYQGYPGDPLYMEFHKKSSESGFRYWRITDRELPMDSKKFYNPKSALERARLHAFHFVRNCSERLEHYAKSGRKGVLTCCFDAELFGHWWHEGIHFLEYVQNEISKTPNLQLQTPTKILQENPPDKVVWLPECSWGAQSDHSTWQNDTTNWMWKALNQAEHQYHQLCSEVQKLSNKRKSELREYMDQFRWNFLLLQASDWAFVITTKGAVDYGFRRFSLHLERFFRLCQLVEKKKNRESWSEKDQIMYQEIVLHEESPFRDQSRPENDE